jgi:hypothetical protein
MVFCQCCGCNGLRAARTLPLAISRSLTASLDVAQAMSDPETIATLQRARALESAIMRDNFRDPLHIATRAAFLERTVPLTSPLYLAGQLQAAGRVIDGKAVADAKLQQVKRRVAALKKVRRTSLSRRARVSSVCTAHQCCGRCRGAERRVAEACGGLGWRPTRLQEVCRQQVQGVPDSGRRLRHGHCGPCGAVRRGRR